MISPTSPLPPPCQLQNGNNHNSSLCGDLLIFIRHFIRVKQYRQSCQMWVDSCELCLISQVTQSVLLHRGLVPPVGLNNRNYSQLARSVAERAEHPPGSCFCCHGTASKRHRKVNRKIVHFNQKCCAETARRSLYLDFLSLRQR